MKAAHNKQGRVVDCRRLPVGGGIADAAATYAEMNLRVVVLHGVRKRNGERFCTRTKGRDCGSPGKHPRLIRWLEMASTDPEEVAALYVKYPKSNVGIATGGEMRLVTIDIDGAPGRTSLTKLERNYGALPASLTAQTGRADGGEHRVFRVPEGLRLDRIVNAVKLAPGIDVRAEGGQIVVAPSMHVSGTRYKWSTLAPIAPLPDAWVQRLAGVKKNGSKTGGAADDSAPMPIEDVLRTAGAYLASIEPAISGKGGHRAAFLAAQAMTRGFCLPDAEALKLLRDTYNPRCEPPWEDKELRHKVASSRADGEKPMGFLLHTVVTNESDPRVILVITEDEHKVADEAIRALASDPLVVIDNVARPLGSPSLDAALTGTYWTDCRLGTNTQVSMELRPVWMATGNNLMVVGDTARRIIHIRLPSPEERPEDRNDFAHPNLIEWVRKKRARLVVAALTILSAYCAAGRPNASLKTWGSFQAWSNLIRGALVWCGLPDPADTRIEFLKEADREGASLNDLLAGLHKLDKGGIGITVSALLARLDDEPNKHQRLRDALFELQPTPPGRPISPRSLGMRLHHLKDRVCGGLKLTRRDGPGGARWSVASASKARRRQAQD